MPQRKRTTEKHLEKRSGEGNVDSRLRVQLRKMKRAAQDSGWRRVVCDTLGVSDKA